MTNAAEHTARGGYEHHSEAVWGYARQDYLDGDTAGAVCARYGIARSTFWDHAGAEGWRRRDQPPPALPPVDIPATFQPAHGMDDEEVQLAIRLRLEEALRRGRATEVAAWLRALRSVSKSLSEIADFKREMETDRRVFVRVSDSSD